MTRPRIYPSSLALANTVAGFPSPKIVGCRLTLKALQHAAATTDEEVVFQLSPSQATATLGLRRGQTDDEVAEILMSSVPMVVVKREGKSSFIYPLEVTRDDETGDIVVEVNRKLVKWVREQKRDFTLLSMTEAMKLSSPRAVNIYLVAARVEKLNSKVSRTVPVETLSKSLRMPKGSKPGDLMREIGRASAEVNAKTPLQVSYVPVKDGKKITAVEFAATRNRKV